MAQREPVARIEARPLRMGRGRDASCLAPPARIRTCTLCIGLLPWVFDGKSLVWPRMEDSRLWEPVVRQLLHPGPDDVTFLAAATKCAPPAVDDSESECAQCSLVRWHCVVLVVARNDLSQPFPLLGDWLVHSPPQFPLQSRGVSPSCGRDGISVPGGTFPGATCRR